MPDQVGLPWVMVLPHEHAAPVDRSSDTMGSRFRHVFTTVFHVVQAAAAPQVGWAASLRWI